MITVTNEAQCCGCAACSETCPVNCISMIEKTLGSKFPQVDSEKCINCGLCEKVCPVINTKKIINPASNHIVAAFSNNLRERFSGSSGGVFPTLAKYFIKSGYVVYGAAFDGSLKLRCVSANSVLSLQRLCKSKYLQSDMSGKYKEIKHLLLKGKKVLFVSSPCQVAALKLYLNERFDNLFTIDFFCHGVPSQKLFDEFLQFEDRKKGRKTTGFSFRTKVRHGKTPHYFTIRYTKNGKEKEKTDYYFHSLFYLAFQQYVSLRESCYHCVFAGQQRCSDMTIGDCHDINRYVPGINRFDGVSTVITNTKNGAEMWKQVHGSFTEFSLDADRMIKDGALFSGCTARPAHRDAFVECYNKGGIASLAEKFLSSGSYRKQQLYYHLPDALRNLLKKTLR